MMTETTQKSSINFPGGVLPTSWEIEEPSAYLRTKNEPPIWCGKE
jgi:hypothetical protein